MTEGAHPLAWETTLRNLARATEHVGAAEAQNYACLNGLEPGQDGRYDLMVAGAHLADAARSIKLASDHVRRSAQLLDLKLENPDG